MNDDPAEVDVLYGRVNALSWSHSLQTIADSLVSEFVKTGELFLQYFQAAYSIFLASFTLHITLNLGYTCFMIFCAYD